MLDKLLRNAAPTPVTTLALALCGGCFSPSAVSMSDSTGSETPSTTGETGDEDTTSSTTDVEAESSSTGGEAGKPGETSIRVVHASPDALAVDVYVAGSDAPVIEGLAYGQASEYLSLDAGTYALEIRPAGGDASIAPLYSTGDLELPAGAVITAAAVGLLEQLEDYGPSAFRVLPLVEDFADAGDATRIRIVHAGSDAPEVGIDVGDDATADATVAPFEETGPDGVELPAGEALQIGILTGDTRVTAFTTPPLPAGTQGFVIATGLLGNLAREDAGFSLLAVVDTVPTRGDEGEEVTFIGQNPTVYALHAGIDVGPVNVCLGTENLLGEGDDNDLAYAQMESFQVPPTDTGYDLDFRLADDPCANSGDPEIPAVPTGALEAGQRYLAIAAGEGMPETDDSAFTLIRATEEFTLGMDDMGVASVIHAASAPPLAAGVILYGSDPLILDVGSDTFPLVLNLTFGTVGDETAPFPRGTYDIGLSASTGGVLAVVDESVVTFPVAAGFRGWVIAAGDVEPDPNPDTEPPLAIWAVDTSANPWALIPLEAPTE